MCNFFLLKAWQSAKFFHFFQGEETWTSEKGFCVGLICLQLEAKSFSHGLSEQSPLCQLLCPVSSPSCSLTNVYDLFLQHWVEHWGRVLDWTVDPSLNVGVVRSWMGRRKLGRVVSLKWSTQAAFTDLQVSCTEEDTWETSRPAVIYSSGLLTAECALCVWWGCWHNRTFWWDVAAQGP